VDGRLYPGAVAIEKREAQVPVETGVQETKQNADETLETRPRHGGQRQTGESDRFDNRRGARSGRDRTFIQIRRVSTEIGTGGGGPLNRTANNKIGRAVFRLHGRVRVRMAVAVAVLLGQKGQRRDRETNERQTSVRVRVLGQFGKVGDHAVDGPVLRYADRGRAHVSRR